MVERGYSESEVLSVLNGNVPSIVFPSPKDSVVDLYLGNAGEKFMVIPVDRETGSIITIRPMRKAEKIIFFERTHHG